MSKPGQPWVRIHVGFPEHRKALAAGPEACWLFVCGLAYSGRNLTDGRIPRGAVRGLSTIRNPWPSAAKLVAAGLWEEDGEDYRVHDYGSWQQSKDDVDRKRQLQRERQARRRSSDEPVTQ